MQNPAISYTKHHLSLPPTKTTYFTEIEKIKDYWFIIKNQVLMIKIEKLELVKIQFF